MYIINNFEDAVIAKITLQLDKELYTLDELISEKINVEIAAFPKLDAEAEFYRFCQLIKDQKIIVIIDNRIITNFKELLLISHDSIVSFIDKDRIFSTAFEGI